MKLGRIAGWLTPLLKTLPFMAVILPSALVAGNGISLERWIAAALERDPDVAEARVEASWERGRVDSLEVWEDPEVRFGREKREDRAYRSTFRLRIPIPNPWEVQAARKEVEARADAEYLRMEAVAWERSMALATLYFEAAHAENLFNLRTRFIDGLTEDFRNAENGYEARAMTRVRLIDMRAELSLARSQLADDMGDWTTLREELRARAGWKDESMTGLSTPLPDPSTITTVPQIEDLQRLAFRERGELGALSAEQRQNKARQAVGRSRNVPWITFLEGNWTREKETGQEDFEARVALTLPVFSWMRRSQTEEALRVIRASDRMEAYSNALESALQSAWHTANAQATRLQSVFETTEESLHEIESALEAPGLDPRSRSGLRDLWMEINEERLDASLDYQMALLDLMGVTGPGFPVRGIHVPQSVSP